MKQQIHNYIVSRFCYGEVMPELKDDDSLFHRGILDSIAVLELIEFVENTFFIQVKDEDLVKSNFDSIQAICSYILNRRQANCEVKTW